MTLAISSHTTHSQQELLALCNSQQPNGFWQPESLLGEQVRSPIATTALITKFLTIYRDNNDSMKPRASLQRRHQQVAYTTKQLFESHAEPLCHSTLASIDKICSSKRTFEITLLSYSFAQALQHPISLTDQQLALLGAANVCGWVAYSIYDDFLDDEGTPSQLPVANVAMRASLECFRTMPPRRRDFERYVAKVFNEMDEANAWEIDNCRFIVRGNTVTIDHLPRYGRQAMLAARSFAHALGPMAILIKHTKSTPSQIRYIESAFRHYLIARQLSDDLHDWTDDMKAGQASYVVIAILRDMRLRSGAYDLPDLLSRMRKQFRHTTMPRICRLALRHIDQAKRNFTRSELLQTSNSIYVLLDELESSLHSWLDQHEKAEALVKAPVSYST